MCGRTVRQRNFEASRSISTKFSCRKRRKNCGEMQTILSILTSCLCTR